MHENNSKYLNLFHIRQSVTAILSILHRVSGAALFVGLPFFIWLLSSSLNQKEAFDAYQAVITNPVVKVILLLFLWAIFHHVLAGIRFLILDTGKGLDVKTAKLTAKIVLFSAPIIALIVGGYLLW
ncbi:succinate dehydrogenase, cytochrome b556 subunit [Neisseriaceae bacterium PsAf]|nr:succinate dehydrogenase, cytochrome b556 subunit [Neisseriaceae bacterium PsAf]MCV2502674.1 succinate dehydrogenase, cytochrome b556 subunit [Neisseriaceae bacterium]